MEMNRSKIFLLLDDNTIRSISCNKIRPPSRYRGRKVIFAAPELEDVNLLRITLRSALIGQ